MSYSHDCSCYTYEHCEVETEKIPKGSPLAFLVVKKDVLNGELTQENSVIVSNNLKDFIGSSITSKLSFTIGDITYSAVICYATYDAEKQEWNIKLSHLRPEASCCRCFKIPQGTIMYLFN